MVTRNAICSFKATTFSVSSADTVCFQCPDTAKSVTARGKCKNAGGKRKNARFKISWETAAFRAAAAAHIAGAAIPIHHICPAAFQLQKQILLVTPCTKQLSYASCKWYPRSLTLHCEHFSRQTTLAIVGRKMTRRTRDGKALYNFSE